MPKGTINVMPNQNGGKQKNAGKVKKGPQACSSRTGSREEPAGRRNSVRVLVRHRSGVNRTVINMMYTPLQRGGPEGLQTEVHHGS
jgi:hypothetical protein